MAYRGLVLTDDLDMGAIVKHHPLPICVRQCLEAGVDILLICHASPRIQEAFDQILDMTESSAELIRKQEESVRRILHFKALFLG
jgi:beta-N-acetylhexosaminidase